MTHHEINTIQLQKIANKKRIIYIYLFIISSYTAYTKKYKNKKYKKYINKNENE